MHIQIIIHNSTTSRVASYVHVTRNFISQPLAVGRQRQPCAVRVRLTADSCIARIPMSVMYEYLDVILTTSRYPDNYTQYQQQLVRNFIFLSLSPSAVGLLCRRVCAVLYG